MIEGVQEELAVVSPLLGRLDALGGWLDERFSHRLIRRARDHAWRKAEALARLPVPEHPGTIAGYDHQVWRLARVICPPDGHVSPLLNQVRQAESDDVPRVIDVLI